MPATELDILPMLAALLTDGSVLLELAVGDDEHLAQVRMPPSPCSRVLAREVVVPLDLDDLPQVAPRLAGEIDWFIAEVRSRLIARAARN